MSILFSSHALGESGTGVIEGTIFESMLRSAMHLKPGEAKTRRVTKEGKRTESKRRKTKRRKTKKKAS